VLPTAAVWTDAIELGVSCFLSLRGRDDDAIYDRLDALGVAPWLSSRLVVWLPIAFGRQLLRAAAFPDHYVSGAVTLRMADDPIYRASVERAGRMTRDEAYAIADRSCEVNAINQLLSSPGATLAELRLAEIALASPLLPMGEGDGGVLEPRRVLRGFLEGHDLAPLPGEGTAVRVGDVEFDAHVFIPWTDGVFMPQVDFVARCPRVATGRLCESFAGIGRPYLAAMSDAVRKFERASLHVMIAALLDPGACADQVTWEDWAHPSGVFRACLGAQLVLYGGVDHAPMGDLVDALRDALAREDLSRQIHALRVYVARVGERVLSNEVLLDGEPWAAGEARGRAHAWPSSERLWGTRLFVALVPAA